MTAPSIEALKAKVEQATELLRLLSSPNRLLLLCHLTQGERSVAEIERDLGVQQPGLSQQLAELRRHGLVMTRRQSRSIFYSIADDKTKAILAMLNEIFCGDPGPFICQKLPTAQVTKPKGDIAAFAIVSERKTSRR